MPMPGLRWGLIGGGEDSQIGYAHRTGATIDRGFEFVAGALDIDSEKGHAYGVRLGLDPDRAYRNWQEMLEGESRRDDRVHLVTVATPNATHFEIARAFLKEGFHVHCEKPMTTDPKSSRELAELAIETGRICTVNFGYTGYPMVREMRALIACGKLGRIRVIVAEFAGGFLADASDSENPRIRWRFDPRKAGVSCVTADAGIHAMHAACYVSGSMVERLSADFVYGVEGRELEDDSLVAFRMTGGIAGRFWSSGLAVGRTHGLALQVYGELGGLYWQQEHPEQLYYTPLGGSTRRIERGSPGLSPAALRGCRLPAGHPEGMVLAFGNIYMDLAEMIRAELESRAPDALALSVPQPWEGVHTIDFIFAAAESARRKGRWVELPRIPGRLRS